MTTLLPLQTAKLFVHPVRLAMSASMQQPYESGMRRAPIEPALELS